MALQPFNGVTPSTILAALNKGSPQGVVSLQFRAHVPPIRALNEDDQWLRLKGILGCSEVYEALGISALPVRNPAQFYYAQELEVIGTLANLLNHYGSCQRFVASYDQALAVSRAYLDAALSRDYASAEAYSCHDCWCEWFIGEGVLDETILLGNRGDWWLLAVTSTD